MIMDDTSSRVRTESSATIKAFLSLTLFFVCQALPGAAHSGPLSVGAARVDITALAHPNGIVPAIEFAHERLYMRAIVLDNGEARAALIGGDIGSFRNIWEIAAPLVSREFLIPVENLVMTGTHTHSSSIAGVTRAPEDVANVVLEVVRMANANMQSAKVGFAEGASYLNVNRDAVDAETRRWTQAANADFPSDKTTAVLAFYDEQGAPIAGYMNYAMHPVNGYQSGFVSADFAGAASRHVEQAFGDSAVVIFTQGASGDQNPLHLRTGTNVMAEVRGDVTVTGFELTREMVEGALRERRVERGPNNPAADLALKRWMDAQGQVLGEEVIRVMSHMERLDGDVDMGAKQVLLTCPGRARVDSGGRGGPGTYADGPDVDILLGFLGINEIAVTTVNAEVYNVIAQQVKAESPLSKTMVVTLANGRAPSGYIVTDDAYGRETFQALGSRLKPGCAQTGIVNNLAGMIYEYVN